MFSILKYFRCLAQGNYYHRNFMKYLYFFSFLIIFSCQEEVLDLPPPPPEEIVDERIIDTFLWEKVIDPETIQNNRLYFIDHTLIHEDNVVFYVPGMKGFVSLNLQDGTTHWDLRGMQDGLSLLQSPLKHGSEIYYVRNSSILNLDLNNGQSSVRELWPIETEFQNVSLSMYKNVMYGNIKEYGNNPFFTEWIKVPIDDLVSPIPWTRFGRYNGTDDVKRPFGRPYFYRTTEGVDLMIFGASRILTFGGPTPYTVLDNTVSAYDINADSIIWEHTFPEDLGGINQNRIMEEERLYSPFRLGLNCLDVENKEVLWNLDEKELGLDLSTGAGLHIYEDKLLAFGGLHTIKAFDKYTGEQLWRLDLDINDEDWFAQGSKKNTVNYYNGRVYYISSWGNLVSLDPNDGSYRHYFLDKRPVIEEYDVELFEPNFKFSAMAISEDGIIYTSEGFRFLAFEVPDKDM